MATIQFELERLYDLVKESQEQRDMLSLELNKIHDTLNATREELDLNREELDSTREELDSTREELDSTREELDMSRVEINELRMQNAKMREFVKWAQHDNYALNHRLESLQCLAHTSYDFIKVYRKEKQELEKQIDVLTSGAIKYKRSIDPDDLEEYVVDHKIYLRDVLTDAIYTRHGKLVGYLDEDTGMLITIKKR
jgi:chromosome segregation ATPase